MENNEDSKSGSNTPSMPPPSMTFKKPMIVGPRPGLKKVQKKNILADEEKSKNKTNLDSENQDKTVEKTKSEDTPKVIDSKPSKPISKEAPVSYKEPSWSGIPEESYTFEVLKGGVIADTINLNTKPYHVFGRLPSCDITLEHPSLSRYHAVVQYCSEESEKHGLGWYIYDLDSTHGTWANKAKLNANTYYRLRVGHVVKFGGSSRLYILQGPAEDQDKESEFSVTDLKQQREKQDKELEVLRHAQEVTSMKPVQEDTGCSWGLGDDAVDEEETAENPFAELPVENEDLYIDDPKKALRGYFEREGLELPEYEVKENGFGKYKCTVELPIDDAMGRAINAEAIISGKKKEAVVQCALEACRILDRHGVLRQAKHESRKRKKKNWEEEDFYDSDDDSFLDRTGNIEKKRKNRMKRAGKLEEGVQTYDSLTERLAEIVKEIEENEKLLEKAKQAACQSDDIDDIDAYVNSIKSGAAMDGQTRMKIKRTIFDLKQEQQKVQKLINIAKPAELPPSKPLANSKEGAPKKQAAIFGKKHHTPITKPAAPPTVSVVTMTTGDVEEEEEEDENETEANDNNTRVDDKVMDIVEEKQRVHDSTEKATVTVPKSVPDSTARAAKCVPDSKSTEDKPDVDKPARAERTVKASPTKLHKSDTVKQAPNKRKLVDKPAEAAKVSKVGKQYCEADPDYDLWVPPTDQAGDGTTSLNAKFGY